MRLRDASMGQLTGIQLFAVWALPILFAITVHEAAHGYIASKFGDDTALSLGRVTFNPIKHIDLMGTIIVPALMLLFTGFVFGWAKPVPINWQKLKNPRVDMALVALAGPFANFLMVFCWAFIAKLGVYLLAQNHEWARAIVYMGIAGININLVLMILNLIPIPPLDGSRVLFSFLPNNVVTKLQSFELIGLFVLVGLLASGLLTPLIIIPTVILKNLVALLFGLT